MIAMGSLQNCSSPWSSCGPFPVASHSLTLQLEGQKEQTKHHQQTAEVILTYPKGCVSTYNVPHLAQASNDVVVTRLQLKLWHLYQEKNDFTAPETAFLFRLSFSGFCLNLNSSLVVISYLMQNIFSFVHSQINIKNHMQIAIRRDWQRTDFTDMWGLKLLPEWSYSLGVAVEKKSELC